MRYYPAGNQQYLKMIVDWPVQTVGGADLDVNPATGEIVQVADPGLFIYRPAGDEYAKNRVAVAYTRGEGAALKVNQATGEMVVVADSYIRIFTPDCQGEPIDTAMTRSCGVDVAVNHETGEIALVDNRGLTLYRKT